jgi:hypothetical protein
MSLALLNNLIEGITTGRMIVGKGGYEAEYNKSRIVFILSFAICLFLFVSFGAIALKFLKLLFYKGQG